MSDPRALLQRLLEALVWEAGSEPALYAAQTLSAVEAIKAELEQTEQEPVAWMTHGDNTLPLFHKTLAAALGWGACPTPLYTHPPRREWRSFSEEEVDELQSGMQASHKDVRAIEAALKEKNHG